MKSSGGAVFTRQNPFVQDPPLGKAHYNPTRNQKLLKEQRKTTVSPVRLTEPSGSPPVQTLYLSPEVLCPPPAKITQPSFSESWPSIDLGSSPANTPPSPNADAATQGEHAGMSMDPDGRGDQEDSVLAKYVERFRHGRPQSREERLFFWGLSPSPLPSSSTPNQTSEKKFTMSPVCNLLHDSSLVNCTNVLDLSATGLSDSTHCYPGDSEILQLQERASRLLHKSEHSVSSGSVPISCEGLACSDFSSPVSVDEPVRRSVIPRLTDSTTANPTTASSHANPVFKPIGLSANHMRPEEDILFQWRLRRKMENVRLWPQSLSQQPHSVSRQDHKVVFPAGRMRGTPHFTPAPQDPDSASHGQCSPESAPTLVPSFPISSPTVSKLPSDAPVSAHMHFLCDVLPCPDRPSPQPAHQKNLQNWQVSGTNVAPRQPSGPASSADTSSEEPASKHEFPPPPASSEATGEEWVDEHRRAEERKTKVAPQRKQAESDKQPGTSSRKKKTKTVRVRGDHAERVVYTAKSLAAVPQQRTPDRAHAWREETSRGPGQQERGQGSTRQGHPGDWAPPPSPIHSALGQVISGVLFPTPGSPPGPRTPMDSPRYDPPTPPQSPAPLASMHSPTEVISQLLQEAEDSDEKEFKDDSLLQVLRKQRRWVKEQMRDVDSLLEDLKEE